MVVAPLRWLVRGISEVILFLIGARPPTRDEGLKEEEFRARLGDGSRFGRLDWPPIAEYVHRPGARLFDLTHYRSIPPGTVARTAVIPAL